jgi:NAD(P)-dependent dehydrogenase (short-subunit alcohol dehydrogenase family)
MSVSQIDRGRWSLADAPDQAGRTAVVTGASAGLGFGTARALADCGATVVLACRDLTKAERAADRIRAGEPRGGVEVVHLDLASLASVRAAAAEIRSAVPSLDLLVNNAGVMDIPFERTEDGFELTLATNHLGPFALTGLLLDRLLEQPESRVVTVSSIAHRRGRIRFDDLQSERRYDQPYAQSKLANLLFTYELQRRLEAAGAQTVALAAHPGNARTELWRTQSGIERALVSDRLRFVAFWMQSAEAGAQPTLRAALDPSAHGGEYYGPAGRFEWRGPAVRVKSSPESHDAEVQRRLWEVSEQLTGVSYPLPTPAS